MDSSTQTTILVGSGIYVLVMLAVGLLVSKKSTDMGDFAASGRSMSMSVCAISIMATWFGAGPMMGAAAAAYSGNKLEVLRDPLVSGIALIIAGFFFARTYNRSRRLTHIAFYETRIGELAGMISIFVNLVAGTIWLGGVLFAFGVVFETLTGQSAALGILGGTAVIIVYTMFGGLKAVAATDVMQMAFIIIGVLILFFVVLDDAGGWATIAPQLPAHAFDFTPEGYDLKSMTTYMQVWLSSGLAAIGVLSLVQRAAAARSEQVAQNAFYIGGAGYLVFGMIPVTIGYIAAVTMPGVENSTAIIPLLAVEHLHPLLVAIFVGAVISAIMSTSDSILLGCGTVISVNLLPRFKSDPSDKLSVAVARWSIPVIAMFSLYFAFNTKSVISAIGLAVTIGFAGMSGPFLLIIWWKKLTSAGGYAGIASGFAVFAVMKFIEADFSPSFAGFYISIIVAVVVSLMTQKSSPPRQLTMDDGEPLELKDRLGTLPLLKKMG